MHGSASRAGATRLGAASSIRPACRERAELEYAAARFPTIELNGSFYSLQRPEYYERWYDQVPSHFLFAVKGSRYITHMKRLRNVETALANFFASGLLALEHKLGPLLWQLPPTLKFDERLEPFLKLLPRTTNEAAKLAHRHDARVAGRAYLRSPQDRELRHALEVRHPSFATPELIAYCANKTSRSSSPTRPAAGHSSKT